MKLWDNVLRNIGRKAIYSWRQIKVRPLWYESRFNYLKDFFIFIIIDIWCIFPFNRMILFQHMSMHGIAYSKPGDIILMLRYPGIKLKIKWILIGKNFLNILTALIYWPLCVMYKRRAISRDGRNSGCPSRSLPNLTQVLFQMQKKTLIWTKTFASIIGCDF